MMSGPWDAATIQRLRDLWDEGHSTAEIGRRMGISKNAVVGKAHRLDLPPRPSPIPRGGERKAPTPYVRRTPVPTLPPLASDAAPVVATPIAWPASLAIAGVAVLPVRTSLPAPQPVQAPPVPGKVPHCLWPMNDGRPWRFCGDPTKAGSVYCGTHDKRAYVRVRAQREENYAGSQGT
jgi:GcrA cell cycle regulator